MADLSRSTESLQNSPNAPENGSPYDLINCTRWSKWTNRSVICNWGMCAHMRGRKTSLLPSDTQLLLKSIYSGLCFTFPRLLIPTCLLEDGHLHVCEFAFFFPRFSGTCKFCKFQLSSNLLESHQSWQMHLTDAIKSTMLLLANTWCFSACPKIPSVRC